MSTTREPARERRPLGRGFAARAQPRPDPVPAHDDDTGPEADPGGGPRPGDGAAGREAPRLTPAPAHRTPPGTPARPDAVPPPSDGPGGQPAAGEPAAAGEPEAPRDTAVRHAAAREERPATRGGAGETAATAGIEAPPEAVAAVPAVPGQGFQVTLDNFEGPFDLLLGLIAKHKLDVTEVALSKVTDEFIAHIRAQGPDWDLGQATEFLVVAATLLDLKAARLLPAAEVEDEADLALLEARDLLFARLLQYRAYKQIAGLLAERWDDEALRYPRQVSMEPRYAGLLPEVVIPLTPERFARLAARAMTPRAPRVVAVEHIHEPLVSVREQALVVVERLRRLGVATFRVLIEDAPDTLHVVARFLVLLELFREAAVGFDQPEALGELRVRWTAGEDPGDDWGAPSVGAEFDEHDVPAARDGDEPERARRRRPGRRQGSTP